MACSTGILETVLQALLKRQLLLGLFFFLGDNFLSFLFKFLFFFNSRCCRAYQRRNFLILILFLPLCGFYIIFT